MGDQYLNSQKSTEKVIGNEISESSIETSTCSDNLSDIDSYINLSTSESIIIIEGYLFKKSIKNMFQLWRKKYFVLFTNKLIYCDKDTDVTNKELTKNLELNGNFTIEKGNENYELIIRRALSNNNQDSGSNNEVGIRLKALNEDEINKWTLKLNYVINNLKINISGYYGYYFKNIFSSFILKKYLFLDGKKENNQEISKSSNKTLKVIFNFFMLKYSKTKMIVYYFIIIIIIIIFKESLSDKIKKINFPKTIESIDQFQDREKTNKLLISDSHRMLSYDRLLTKVTKTNFTVYFNFKYHLNINIFMKE